MKYFNILFFLYLNIFNLLSVFVCMCILLFSFVIVFKLIFESNHISLSPYVLIDDMLIIIAFYFINAFFPRTRKISIIVLSLCVASIFVIYALDKFNLLVEYHDWIRRGMPPKPWQ